MIYLIAAQPPPSAQDFTDLEQALIEGRGDEDLQAKTESVKAAFQWVRRSEVCFAALTRIRSLLQFCFAHTVSRIAFILCPSHQPAS